MERRVNDGKAGLLADMQLGGYGQARQMLGVTKAQLHVVRVRASATKGLTLRWAVVHWAQPLEPPTSPEHKSAGCW